MRISLYKTCLKQCRRKQKHINQISNCKLNFSEVKHNSISQLVTNMNHIQ